MVREQVGVGNGKYAVGRRKKQVATAPGCAVDCLACYVQRTHGIEDDATATIYLFCNRPRTAALSVRMPVRRLGLGSGRGSPLFFAAANLFESTEPSSN